MLSRVLPALVEVLRRRRDGGQVGDRDQGDEEVEEPLGANESQDLVSLVHFLALPDGPFSCDLSLLPRTVAENWFIFGHPAKSFSEWSTHLWNQQVNLTKNVKQVDLFVT